MHILPNCKIRFVLYMTAARIDKVLSYNCCCLSSKTSKERKYRNVAATSEAARRVGPAVVVSILGSIVEITAKRLSSTSSDLESNIARSYIFGVNELFLINEIRQDTFTLACIWKTNLGKWHLSIFLLQCIVHFFCFLILLVKKQCKYFSQIRGLFLIERFSKMLQKFAP